MDRPRVLRRASELKFKRKKIWDDPEKDDLARYWKTLKWE
jgi:hypothetical protein